MKTVDFIVEGIDRSKGIMIIMEKGDEVSNALMEAFAWGATTLAARGGYSDSDKTMVYFVVNRFRPICDKTNFQALRDDVVSTTKAVYKVFLLWCGLLAIIGILHYSGVIGKTALSMIFVAF